MSKINQELIDQVAVFRDGFVQRMMVCSVSRRISTYLQI